MAKDGSINYDCIFLRQEMDWMKELLRVEFIMWN